MGERQILYDLIYNRNLINTTKEHNRTKDMETRNRLTMTRLERAEGERGKEGEGSSQEHI